MLHLPPARLYLSKAVHTYLREDRNQERESERVSLHLFQPPRADQMPDPHQGQGFYKYSNKALYLG